MRDVTPILDDRLRLERRRANAWMFTALLNLLITIVVTAIATDAMRVAGECLGTLETQGDAIRQQREAIGHYDRLLREQIDTSRTVITHLERCQRRGRVFDAGI